MLHSAWGVLRGGRAPASLQDVEGNRHLRKFALWDVGWRTRWDERHPPALAGVPVCSRILRQPLE